MENMIVYEGREQIMARGNGVRIPCQMEIDVLHRDDLSATAARPASLDAEHRSQRWLAERHHGALTDPAQTHRQSDGSRRFPFPQRRRINRGDKNIAALGFVLEAFERRETDLRFVPPVWMEFVRREPELFADVLDREGLIRSRNIEIAHGPVAGEPVSFLTSADDRTKKHALCLTT